MTPQPAHQSGYTIEEYLALEEASIERHELIQGEIYAMTGGSAAHASVCLNIASALKSHLRGAPCQSFMADTCGMQAGGMGVRSSFDAFAAKPDLIVKTLRMRTSFPAWA